MWHCLLPRIYHSGVGYCNVCLCLGHARTFCQIDDSTPHFLYLYNPRRSRGGASIVMKKLITIFCALFLGASMLVAQDFAKAAKKEAKSYSKEGWIVAPGHLPLEKQLEKSYNMSNQTDDMGYPKYVTGEAMSIGKNYDAAKMQALELAKLTLAGKLQTEVVALVDNNLGNTQLPEEQAESVTKTVMASKNLIAQKIGRVITVVECYREKDNKNKEVRVMIAYNMEMAVEAAKQAVREELMKKGDELHARLDELMKM